MTVKESPEIPAETPPLKQKLKDALVALSVANFCFIGTWLPPLYDPNFIYGSKLRAARVTALALVANISWLGLLIWSFIRIWRRTRNRWLGVALEALFLCLLMLPLNLVRANVAGIPVSRLIVVFKQPAPALAGLALLSVIVWQLRRVARLTAIGFGILSPLALFIVARVALLGLRLEFQSPIPQGLLRPPSPVPPGQARMVWIIFDETDQRVLFEKHPANLSFPEFERLRGESLYATNAYPPSGATMRSMPGLISGCVVAKAAASGTSDLKLTLADTGQTALWTRLPSVFAAARSLGFNSALVGWYHPYNRVLSGDLNYCWWQPAPWSGSAEPKPLGGTMLDQLASLVNAEPEIQRYINLCRGSLVESVTVVTNGAYGLILLHLPPPHAPGVFLPEKDQYTLQPVSVATGYFNNLALADRFLGEIRRVLASSDLGRQTWLLVSADHFWRWSASYDGQNDHRIPFMLKAPGETTPMLYSNRFNTALTKELILSILRREVANEADACVWLDAHRSNQNAAATYRTGPAGSIPAWVQPANEGARLGKTAEREGD